jgi:hypothetical protein
LWERKDILAFCLALPLECENKHKIAKIILLFLIFSFPFSTPVGDALNVYTI